MAGLGRACIMQLDVLQQHLGEAHISKLIRFSFACAFWCRLSTEPCKKDELILWQPHDYIKLCKGKGPSCFPEQLHKPRNSVVQHIKYPFSNYPLRFHLLKKKKKKTTPKNFPPTFHVEKVMLEEEASIFMWGFFPS